MVLGCLLMGTRRIVSKTVKRSVGQSPFREETVGASLGLLCHTAALELPAMSRTFPALREKKETGSVGKSSRRSCNLGGTAERKAFRPNDFLQGKGREGFFILPARGGFPWFGAQTDVEG